MGLPKIAMTQTLSNPLRGILMKCLSVLIFTVMGALIKATSTGDFAVPAGQQVFFRSFFALPVILVWLAFRGDLRSGLRTHRPMGHFWRGICGTAAMALWFKGMAMLPFPEVTALNYAAPLFTVLLAALLLGEQVRLFRLSMVGLGLIGVLIVLSPRLTAHEGLRDGQMLGALVTLAGACCTAMAMIFVRKLAQQEQTSAIVFWFSVTSTVLSLLTLPSWILPGAGTLAVLVAIGLLGGVAQILLTSAYRLADASLVAPFEYVSMLLALAIGWYFFDEAATPTMLAGAALVITAGILIIWRERQLGLERNRQRKAMTPQG